VQHLVANRASIPKVFARENDPVSFLPPVTVIALAVDNERTVSLIPGDASKITLKSRTRLHHLPPRGVLNGRRLQPIGVDRERWAGCVDTRGDRDAREEGRSCAGSGKNRVTHSE